MIIQLLPARQSKHYDEFSDSEICGIWAPCFYWHAQKIRKFGIQIRVGIFWNLQ